MARHAVTAVALLAAAPHVYGQGASVSGTVRVLDRDDRAARDVGQAVVWLEPRVAVPIAADSVEVITEDKQFRPRISVVTVGSLVSFPNNDSFNHNVFSLSEAGPFDLGLYGRRRARATRFDRPGVINVYCNVHSNMSALLVVLDTELYTRPGADGRFTIDDVPPGRYTLKVWHERAAQTVEHAVVVPSRGVADLAFELDARRFERVEHLNKFGQPYRRTGRRY